MKLYMITDNIYMLKSRPFSTFNFLKNDIPLLKQRVFFLILSEYLLLMINCINYFVKEKIYAYIYQKVVMKFRKLFTIS